MESERESFLRIWEHEYKTTIKVLEAYPEDKMDFKPHELSKTARDVAWMFPSHEEVMIDGILEGEIKFAKARKPPATMREIIDEYKRIHQQVVKKFKDTPDADLAKTMSWSPHPGEASEMRRFDVIWFITFDHIHHRGQFSIYLRMAGGKVPSIYGPSIDEPRK